MVGVIDRYLEESSMLLEAIDRAVDRGIAKDLQHAAHTLKSSSALLGAIELSGLCQELETRGGKGLLDGTAEIVTQLKTEYDQVQTALLQRRQYIHSTLER